MSDLQVFKASEFESLVATLNRSFDSRLGYVLLLDQPLSVDRLQAIEGHPSILCFAVAGYKAKLGNQDWPTYVSGFLNDPENPNEMLWVLEQAKRVLDLRHENEQLRFKMQIEKERFQQLVQSSLEFSSERDSEKLSAATLSIARKLTQAEGASLYLVPPQKPGYLRLSHAQNEFFQTEVKSFDLPIDQTSMAGASGLRKAIIHIPNVDEISESETFRFNKSFDLQTGYRTRSALCFPLLNKDQDLVGVIQLINSKRSQTFNDQDIEIGKALSTQIAIAFENARLHEEIENLFEGFIQASVTAIESRDPTTSGHSERVSVLTLKLAEEVHDSNEKAFREIRFDALARREIRYAALLHDFGKIGVPESILLKEKKLFAHELSEIKNRVDWAQSTHPQRKAEFEDFWRSILAVNEPTVSIEKLSFDLSKYLQEEVRVGGKSQLLLNETEWAKLSIRKGSLSESDRRSIESHVTHTYRFLSQIPWTRALKRVPEIAHSHHEKLDGTGYPRQLVKAEIPFESQMMAIIDIFDALTAPDRPYKKSVSPERALEILREDAAKSKLNAELVELFYAKKIHLFNAFSSR